jgi:hypothetical protein
MRDIDAINLRDLKSGGVFKLVFFSIFGIQLVTIPLFIWVFSSLPIDVGGQGAVFTNSFWPAVVIAVMQMIIGPLMFALYAMLGRWVYGKVFKSKPQPDLEFSSLDRRFETLKPRSLFKAAVLCFRGIMLTFICFFGIFWLLFLIVSVFTGEIYFLAVLLMQMGVMALMYFVYPYIWAFFLMLGSYVAKPIVGLFGWGDLGISEPNVGEVFE